MEHAGDEYERTIGVTDGVISVAVPGLTVGDKTVTVTYNGDNVYLSSGSSDTFNVGKATVTLDVVVENITYGEIETITVITNATVGRVTINIPGVPS